MLLQSFAGVWGAIRPTAHPCLDWKTTQIACLSSQLVGWAEQHSQRRRLRGKQYPALRAKHTSTIYNVWVRLLCMPAADSALPQRREAFLKLKEKQKNKTSFFFTAGLQPTCVQAFIKMVGSLSLLLEREPARRMKKKKKTENIQFVWEKQWICHTSTRTHTSQIGGLLQRVDVIRKGSSRDPW